MRWSPVLASVLGVVPAQESHSPSAPPNPMLTHSLFLSLSKKEF